VAVTGARHARRNLDRSGALNAHLYGFNTRFEGVKGTSPEELIGADHAACFTMALSKILADSGLTAASLDTKAVVSLDKVGDGFGITGIELSLRGSVPGRCSQQRQMIEPALVS